MREIVKIEDMDLYFESKTGIIPIFKNLSFNLDKGEKIGILGKSGSGKTSFFKINLK